ncbi:MAG: FliM/FliN family flagellar motor switch protein [Rhodobacteraceae bacterium]|nr:FliM/FliN family flagellar motor switch protein [Paracoccaceae bacterium]
MAAEPSGATDPGALLRLALGRAARATVGLALACDPVRHVPASLTEVLERAEPGMLLAITENADGAPGIVMLDAVPALGMIESQLLGAVPGAVSARRLTRTDVALVAPLLDAALREWDALMAPQRAWAALAGFRVVSFLDDPRPMALILDDGAYALLETRVSLGEGTCAGRWVMAMPMPAAPAADAATRHVGTGLQQAAPVSGGAGTDWRDRLRSTVSGCPIALDAVLARVRLPLHAALDLKPGMVVELPLSVLEAVQVEAAQGAQVATARLGQTRGMRALRLTMDPREGADPVLARAAQISPAADPVADPVSDPAPPQDTPEASGR